MDRTRLPFRRLSGEQWLNLARAGLALLYLVLIGSTLYINGPIGLGSDYYAFRATAEIVRARGFAAVYDLTVQEQFQRPIYDELATGVVPFHYETVPTPYLPAFLPFFLVLLPFRPLPGLAFWTILNGVALVLYLRRFFRASGDGPQPIVPLLLTYPAFSTLLYGQVNVWLLIFLGEFLLNVQQGREFRGGLWLTGMLLKPQTLIMLLPGLLLSRRFKSLGGVLLGGLAVAGLSVLLVGTQGMGSLLRLLVDYGQGVGLASNYPQYMMNWRALGLNLERLLPPIVDWGIVIVGIAVTTGVTLSLWRRREEPSAAYLALILLGSYAGTSAVAWHMHIHTALPLLAPALWLQARGRLPQAVLPAWGMLPAAVFFLATPFLLQNAAGLTGICMLAVNLGLLAWAKSHSWKYQAGSVADSPVC